VVYLVINYRMRLVSDVRGVCVCVCAIKWDSRWLAVYVSVVSPIIAKPRAAYLYGGGGSQGVMDITQALLLNNIKSSYDDEGKSQDKLNDYYCFKAFIL